MKSTAVQLTDGDIQAFIKLCQEKRGITLDKDTAKTKLHRLVRSIELVYQPITKEQATALKDEDLNEDYEQNRQQD